MQRFLLGTAPTLVAYPPAESDGVPLLAKPSAADVRIGTPAVAMPAEGSEVTATVDAVSTATTASSARGALTLTVTSATFVRGRQYLVVLASGSVLVVVSEKSVTGTTLYMTEPLLEDVASGCSVLGYACTRALSTAQTALVGRGTAVFRATLGGVMIPFAAEFRVVRRLPAWPLTSEQLTSHAPWVRTKKLRSDVGSAELLRAGLDIHLLPALRSKGIDEEDIISTEPLFAAHVAACCLQALYNDRTSTPELRAEARDDFDRALVQALASKGWYEVPQEDAYPSTSAVASSARNASRVSR